jgi:hypothetical protein
MNFPSIRLEGAILTADLLDAIAREDKHSQKAADFGLDQSVKVKDEIASTWASAKALWTGYQAKIANLHEGQTGVSETRNLFIIPLLALLGYQPEKADAEIVNGKSYAISHRDISRDGFPLHIMGWHDSLEKKRESGGPRISSHALVQEYLNLTEHTYGIITNGRQLRLLRDSSRLIKLSFLEFDLNRIFEEDLYADFAILFRLIHATRMPANRANASGSVIEKYHQESVDSGSRIRDGLAAAVAFSMQTVANGLLTHPANANLVDQLKKEPGRTVELHQNLLRWVYRTLFVLVIEERVLHHAPTATLRQRQLYRDYYSLQRLRRLADRPQLADRRAHDLWRAMHQTLRLYEDGGKGLPLGIAALGSFLFREEGLQQLFQYQLDNRSLLQALNRLSTFTHPDTNVRMRVNYGALDVEEFGSVYESLLELRPRIIPEGEKLSFSYAQLAGNERKTTGSYYTPDSLVQCLLDSALDPVVDERLAGKTGKEAEQALLAIKVCDLAVGSGHFLIGAAHRLAQRLADIRAGEEALSPDVQRHALRDVVSHCLYGVDINPLSVELCKVSLWMLAMEPGKPLGFLDHHIRCGNSLLGTTPELVAEGLPDDAFNVIEGDDKQACAELKKRNKGERKGLGVLFAKEDAANREKLQKAVSAIDAIGDDSPEAIRRKEAAFKNTQQNYDFQKARDLADLWCAAFVIKKHFPATADSFSPIGGEGPDEGAKSATASLDSQPLVTQGGLFGGTEELPKTKGKKAEVPSRAGSENPIGITTQHLRDFVEGGELPDGLLAEAKRLAEQYQFFHYHLAFPEVFAQGGFDVSLGNPPWERFRMEHEEFFAATHPGIANASVSKREMLIDQLRIEDPQLAAEWFAHCREVEGASLFVRCSGRYPLSGRSKFNTAGLFTEGGLAIVGRMGRCGLVIPTGVATDEAAKDLFDHVLRFGILCALFDFINTKGIFAAVHAQYRFSLLTLGRRSDKSTNFTMAFLLTAPEELLDKTRTFQATASEIQEMNPNTGTCPSISNSRDFYIIKAIHSKHPVLIRDKPETNPWGAVPTFMFQATDEEGVFRKLSDIELLPSDSYPCGCSKEDKDAPYTALYEAKLLHQFDHRFATFEGQTKVDCEEGQARPLTETDRQNPLNFAITRFWIPAEMFRRKMTIRRAQGKWFITYREVTNATNERTIIAAITPFVAASRMSPQIYLTHTAAASASFLGVLNSFVFDFAARCKLTSPGIRNFFLKQLPVPTPAKFGEIFVGTRLEDWVALRVLELTFTAWDLEAFAQDCGWSGPPFRWEEERRFLLRCELDAAFFHLYLGPESEWRQQPEALTKAFPTPRHAVDYILDTFPIVKRKDEAKFNGDYRTKRTILEIYDALAEAITTGQPYHTRLDPPPADPRCCHPQKEAQVYG